MQRNFGFPKDEVEEELEKKVDFWTGFFVGGITASATLVIILAVVAYNLP